MASFSGADVMKDIRRKRLLQKTKEEKLYDAIKARDLENVCKWLGSGAHIDLDDTYGMTPLMVAADLGDLDICKEILEKGAKVNLKDSLGQTALMMAAFKGHYNVVKLLLDHKAITNLQTVKGQTVLHKVCYTRYQHTLMIATLLCERKCKIDTPRGDGRTCLMIAAEANSLDVAEYLIKLGCNKDAQDEEGNTAIHIAAKSNNMIMVKALVAAGANPSIKNGKKQTPEKITEFVSSALVDHDEKELRKMISAAIKEGVAEAKGAKSPKKQKM